MPSCIEISELTKNYAQTVAVDRLSLKVEQGEVLGLLGPNGAGKSTTLAMLAGLVPPTSGSIALFGKPLRRSFIELISRVGVLMERPTFYEHLSVRRNLLILAALARRNVTVDRALDMVGLLPVATKKTGTLSRGMRQRLGLAQALVTEPDLLLLDEPTSGLDAEATLEVLNLLRRLADEARVTILFSSHMMHEVEVLCDRVAVIHEGSLVGCEATQQLLSYDPNQVEVVLDAAEAAARRLAELEWVDSAKVVSGRLQVRLTHGAPHQLTAFLVNAGYRVTAVIPRRRTLQEYFLKVLNR
ncbi:MAG TPA: ABC transporter ATP-binding protein [Candidatus Hydrogenedentes bacterium]|nr:ABC transporter ATP-binding protein [Candidatus Hydrogenedentota bacterium]